MPLLDVFTIVNNEEELLAHCLESYASFRSLIGVVSIVDNNSTDATLDIIERYKSRLPIVLQHHYENSHHGQMRNKALSVCTAPWIFYLDGDETITSDFGDWLASGEMERADYWEIFKYTTIIDRYHYVEGGNGYTWRLFRNLPGVGFPQEIHTEAQHPGLQRRAQVPNVFMSDHTAIKSNEALWAKGIRYAWANRLGVPAVGPIHEYRGRVDDAFSKSDLTNLYCSELASKGMLVSIVRK